MGLKLERIFSRSELADFLAGLREQLRRGRLEAGGQLWSVPERLDTKIHLKEEDGAVAAKISWHWPAQASHPGSTEAVSTPPQPQLPQKAPSREHPAFKAVKIRLAAAFKEVQRVVKEGMFPEAQTLQDLVENSRLFAEMGQPPWQQPLAEYLAHLENLRSAVETRQLETVRQEVHNLQNSMASCHREFK